MLIMCCDCGKSSRS